MILIIIAITIIFITEGFHDYYVWKSSTNDKYEYTKIWHKIDFVYNVFVWSMVSYLIFGLNIDAILFLIFIAITRMLMLNSTINLLRGMKISYLSENSNVIDKLLHKYEDIVFVVLILIYISGFFIFN